MPWPPRAKAWAPGPGCWRTWERTRRHVRSRLEGESQRGGAASDAQPELSEASQRVLRLARTESHLPQLHRPLDAGHLLLGMVLADDSLASRVLKEAGIEIEAARARVAEASHSA